MRGEAQELVKASFGPTLLCTIGRVYESQAQVGIHQQGSKGNWSVNRQLKRAMSLSSELGGSQDATSWGLPIVWRSGQ